MPSSVAARLEERVRHLSETIGERHYRRPDALARAARYIADQLAHLGVGVVEHEFSVAGQRFVNLEVVAPRADGPSPEPGCIVVGAHYDTVPGTPGADDNASGVAALLELVQELARGVWSARCASCFFRMKSRRSSPTQAWAARRMRPSCGGSRWTCT